MIIAMVLRHFKRDLANTFALFTKWQLDSALHTHVECKAS